MRQLVGFLIVMMSLGCSGFHSQRWINQSAKTALLTKETVFLSQSLAYCDSENAGPQVATGAELGGDICQVVNPDGTPGTVPSPSPGSPSTPTQIPVSGLNRTVKVICSNELVGTNGGSVKSGNELKIQVADPSGQIVCEIKNPQIQKDIINEKKLAVSSEQITAQCPFLKPGEYNLLLKNGNSLNLMSDAVKDYEIYKNHPRVSPAKGFMSLWEGKAIPVGVKATEYSPGLSFQSQNPEITVLLGTNPGGQSYEGPIADCDYAASPLLVQISYNSLPTKPLSLSAPLSGTKFDILGANSYPTLNSKKQISWLKGRTAEGNYFIVLPKQGQVLGIDQMFGDNTRGPDGKFASNGYEALRKYDSNNDGLITTNDSVFVNLRLWSDSNGNGISEASELIGLSDMGVEAIDLNYDPSFREVNRYGNEIKMKSVVKTRDQKLHVMYDVWFRIID